MNSHTVHLSARTLAYFILSTLLFLCSALPLRTEEGPVQCGPINFKGVLVFFLGNYVAHAATVPSRAGGKWMESLPFVLFSLMYPLFGLTRALAHFDQYLKFGKGKDEIGMAIAQGAVMVAVRSEDWEPSTEKQRVFVGLPSECFADTKSDGHYPKVKFEVIPLKGSFDVQNATHVFHGETSLPKGYKWSILNSFCLDGMLAHNLTRSQIRVGRSQSWLKMFTSVAQLVLSCITLYRTRGTQLDQYGYAAFGLSVFPYALMSLVNLVVTGFIGEYTCLFVLRTAISEEAKEPERGGKISGELGMLEADDNKTSLPIEESGDETKVIGTSPRTNGPSDEVGTSLVMREGGELLDKRSGVNWARAKGKARAAILEVLQRAMQSRGLFEFEMTTRPTTTVSIPKEELLSGQKEFTAAWLRTKETEHGKILVVEIIGSSTTKMFRLVDRNDSDNVLTFYVDSITNQRILKSEHKNPTLHLIPYLAFIGMYVLGIFLPYIIIFSLTGFHKGRSTVAQRGWMMAWVVMNQGMSFFPLIIRTDFSIFGGAANKVEMASIARQFLIFGLIYSAPAVGGFVMVGKMLVEFGSCSVE